ncbi:hypothetical protein [Amycolatopsis sp. RTGN1]|nr:hypothetical protein [Amycolatopsis sp. RTGN1]
MSRSTIQWDVFALRIAAAGAIKPIHEYLRDSSPELSGHLRW